MDEYDAICSCTFPRVDSSTLVSIIDFYSNIIGSVIKTDSDYIERAVLTGITTIMPAGMSNLLNNVKLYPFLENSNFVPFYGILEEEFHELMARKCNSSVHHLKHEALSYYNGYTYSENRILNTWSVMNFLSDGIVRPYWIESGVQELNLEHACKYEEVRMVVLELLRGSVIKSEKHQFDAKNFKMFYKNFVDPDSKLLNCDPIRC